MANLESSYHLPKFKLQKEYTLAEAEAVATQVLDVIEGLESEIVELRDIEVTTAPEVDAIDRMVARRTRLDLERRRNAYTTFLTNIEKRIIPDQLMRYTVVVSGIKLHEKYDPTEKYHSAIGQLFVVNPTDEDAADLEERLFEKLISFIEDYVGYPEGDWWFSLNFRRDMTGWQLVDYKKNKDQIDRYYLRIEDRYGVAEDTDEGKVDEL